MLALTRAAQKRHSAARRNNRVLIAVILGLYELKKGSRWAESVCLLHEICGNHNCVGAVTREPQTGTDRAAGEDAAPVGTYHDVEVSVGIEIGGELLAVRLHAVILKPTRIVPA